MVQQLKLVGPTNKNQFFLCYQTLKYVVVGEPHPQPHYQTASKSDLLCHKFADVDFWSNTHVRNVIGYGGDFEHS